VTVPRPSAISPGALLRKSASLYGQRVAFSDDAGNEVTYADLLDRSVRLVNALRAMDIAPGERVALLVDNRLESLEHITGLALGGYVRCALYTHDTAERHRYLLDLTEASALIVQDAYLPALAPLLDELDHLRTVIVLGKSGERLDYHQLLASADSRDPLVRVHEEDAHVIRFSAGTTGLPKGIVHSVRAWMDMGNEVALVLEGFSEEDCYLAVGPFTHAAGVIAWPLIAAGARTIVLANFEPERYLELVESERATVTIVGPTMIKMLTEHPAAARRDLSSLRAVAYGTAPAPEATVTRAIEVWGNIMYQIYGQSEGLPLTILGPRHHVVDGTPEQRRWLRSAGRPTPNAMIRIVDEDDNELPAGEVGEVVGFTPGRMTGIWGQPEATAERITADGWLRTRDMGSLSEDGFLYIADRKEDTIISGGFNIWPNELENALTMHPAVAEAAVVGVPHDKWGQTPHAVVVRRGGVHVDEQELIAWTREKVGSVKKITAVTFVPELPRTPIGKVLRRVLREQLQDESVGAGRL
jgi:acyl-CoA synthetase (AMP-forming)/AMP-acid ligase II